MVARMLIIEIRKQTCLEVWRWLFFELQEDVFALSESPRTPGVGTESRQS